MPSTGFLTCTGEGSAVISGGSIVQVLGVESYLQASTNTRAIVKGAVSPKGLAYFGTYGITYPSVNEPINPTDVVVWDHSVKWTNDYRNLQPWVIYGSRVFWKLPLGVTLRIDVFF